MYIEFNDYDLQLRNGEKFRISEIILDRVSDPDYVQVLTERGSLLDWIPYIPHSIMEEAKRGLDISFTRYIGSPPIAILKRINNNKCFNRFSCASYFHENCTMKPKQEREKKEFPRCWEADLENEKRRLLMTSIIYQVRENRNVIVVIPD